jgi:FkbM family methyltransferase
MSTTHNLPGWAKMIARPWRDRLGQVYGSLLYRFPALQQPFIQWNQNCVSLGEFRRQAIDALVEIIRKNQQQHRKISVGKVDLVFDVADLTSRYNVFAGQRYEPNTTDFLISRLRPGNTFLDIGANHGYFSVLAGLCVGREGKVFAFEPNPAVVAGLRSHVSLNALDGRVEIVETAVSDEDNSKVEFFVGVSTESSVYSSLVPSQFALQQGWLSNESKILVTTRTLDKWIADRASPRIDVIKIDVEGAELSVLKGMPQTLAVSKPRSIICETTWDGEAHRLLQSYGYKAQELDCSVNGYGNILFEMC